MKHYQVEFWVDEFNLSHCKIVFNPPGLGNSPEARRIMYNAKDWATTLVRADLKRKYGTFAKRGATEISANYVDPQNRMRWFIVSEKMEGK